MKTISNTKATLSTNLQVEAAYEMARGTQTIEVIDEMITNEYAARARAEAIFLEQSYSNAQITLTTFHHDFIEIADYISYESLNYIVTKLEYNITGAKVSMTITAKRWY